jgi:PIN domain nuclease of toxin-antitoxin system
MTEQPLLIDTHVWLWWENGSPGRISAEARRAIGAAEDRAGLWIASMSVWEVAMLDSKRRVEVAPDALTWMRASLARPDRVLVPLTPEIAIASTRLPEAPVGDPVDRILLATARVENMTLVTADRKLLDYGKRRHVKVLPV